MPRVARKDFQASFFHLITQGINKEYIYSKSQYIEEYIRLMNKYKKEYNIVVIAYCIMNNHAHLLLNINEVENMIKYMHRINGIYAQYYNKKENRVGVVFRNRYISEPIYNDNYLMKCIKYIHMNPVKAGMVKKCDEYEYSSYNQYFMNNNIEKLQILRKIFGNNVLEKINNVTEDVIFKDVDTKREEILEFAINEFVRINKKDLEIILNDRESKKRLIKFLKNEYKIKYVEMMKRFGITVGEMHSLKK